MMPKYIFAIFSKLIVVGMAYTINAIIAFSIITVTYMMFGKIYPASYSTIVAGVKN